MDAQERRPRSHLCEDGGGWHTWGPPSSRGPRCRHLLKSGHAGCGVVPRGPRPSYLPWGPEGGRGAMLAAGPPRRLQWFGARAPPYSVTALDGPRTKPVRSRLPGTVTLSILPSALWPSVPGCNLAPCHGRAQRGWGHSAPWRRSHGHQEQNPGVGHAAACRRAASEATSAVARTDSCREQAILW